MPNWLKWLLAVAALCAATAVWLLTADYGRTSDDRQLRRQSTEVEYSRVLAQLSRASRLAWAGEQLAAGDDVVLRLGSHLPAAFTDSIEAGLASEFAPAAAPRVQFGLLWLPSRLAVAGMGVATEYYAASTGDRAWCAGVTPRMATGRNGRLRTPFDERVLASEGPPEYTTRRLGPCRLWSRFGPPGPGVEAWLVRTGGYFALVSTPPPPLPAEWRGAGLFGRPRWLEDGLVLAPCQAGALPECRSAILAPREHWRRPNVSPPGVVAMYADWYFSQGAAAGLLAAVEEEFGRERFARFWRSDADVATAFAQAFGVPIEVWTADWVQDLMGRREAGPRLAASTLLLALVTLGLLVAAALQVARRRTIG